MWQGNGLLTTLKAAVGGQSALARCAVTALRLVA